jgi:hypothetical protein
MELVGKTDGLPACRFAAGNAAFRIRSLKTQGPSTQFRSGRMTE